MTELESSESPILPPELERKIFEFVVQENPSSALPLMLVAHRAHSWIASILYSVVDQLGLQLYPPKGNLPAADLNYYGPFVKHIILGGDMDIEEISKFFIACPNLIDIALWSSFPAKHFLKFFEAIKLQRLSMNLSSLDIVDFHGPTFSFITHLDVTAFREGWSCWKAMTYIPRLTHLAINNEVDVDILRQLLHDCKQLRILLIVDWDSEKMGNTVIQDPRFVMMQIGRYTIEAWKSSASGKGERDMWAWAEKISFAKQSGYFKDENSLCTWFKESDWEEQLRRICDGCPN
ncbi:hypothetical protein BDZ97DRAFT_2057867 [Flammula alnicola]|nr:hypothetical protein BDZ97DRAFT_2057867 [Flammula alnicola]